MLNLSNLHLLRGFAAFYVVIYHAKFFLWSGGVEFLNFYPLIEQSALDKVFLGIDLLSSAGREMVYVFFILSGFFISLSISKSYTFYQFLALRLIRIYFPLLVSLFVAFLSFQFVIYYNPSLFSDNYPYFFNQELKIAFDNFDFSCFIKSFFLTRQENVFFGNNFVYWSLGYEVMFYFLMIFCKSKTGKKAFVFLSFLYYFSLKFFDTKILIENIDTSYVFFFGVGVFTQLIYDSYKDALVKFKVEQVICQIFAILTFAGIVFFLKVKPSEIISQIFTVLFSLVLMTWFLKFSFKKNFFAKIFRFLGEISYSLYLIHIPVLLAIYAIISREVNDVIWYSRWQYWVGVIICIPFGYLLYYFAEKPSLRFNNILKKRFISN